MHLPTPSSFGSPAGRCTLGCHKMSQTQKEILWHNTFASDESDEESLSESLSESFWIKFFLEQLSGSNAWEEFPSTGRQVEAVELVEGAGEGGSGPGGWPNHWRHRSLWTTDVRFHSRLMFPQESVPSFIVSSPAPFGHGPGDASKRAANPFFLILSWVFSMCLVFGGG